MNWGSESGHEGHAFALFGRLEIRAGFMLKSKSRQRDWVLSSRTMLSGSSHTSEKSSSGRASAGHCFVSAADDLLRSIFSFS